MISKKFFCLLGQGEGGADGKMCETLRMYEEGGFTEWFSRMRAWDAPFKEVEKVVPEEGVVTDLGSGDGLLANFLGVCSASRKILGIELDAKRVDRARRGLPNVRFVKGDILKVAFPASDCILLVHVLHHLSSKKNQEELIFRCVKKLKKRGRLVVVEIDRRPWFKYVVTWVTDAVIYSALFEGKWFTRDFYYRTEEEWLEVMGRAGLKVKWQRADKGKPFSHVIILGERRQ